MFHNLILSLEPIIPDEGHGWLLSNTIAKTFKNVKKIVKCIPPSTVSAQKANYCYGKNDLFYKSINFEFLKSITLL